MLFTRMCVNKFLLKMSSSHKYFHYNNSIIYLYENVNLDNSNTLK